MKTIIPSTVWYFRVCPNCNFGIHVKINCTSNEIAKFYKIVTYDQIHNSKHYNTKSYPTKNNQTK